jgi:hypothetical protein
MNQVSRSGNPCEVARLRAGPSLRGYRLSSTELREAPTEVALMVPPRVRDVLVALFGAVILLVLRRPTSGQDTSVSRCWNAFGHEVPCEGSSMGLAVAVALALFTVMYAFTLWRAQRG